MIFAYTLLWTGIVLLIGFLMTAPPELADALVEENGLIESLSAMGWFVAAGFLLTTSALQRWQRGFAGAFLLLAFGLRELDFHKRFTTMGIIKIKFFLSGDVPITEKIIALLVLGFFLLMAWLFLRGRIGWFVQRLKDRAGPAVALAALVLLLGASKVLDRLPNAVREIGIPFPGGASEQLGIIEETVELGLPLMALLVIIHWTRQTFPHDNRD